MALLVNLLTKFTRMSVGGKGDVTSCINTIKLINLPLERIGLRLALRCAFLHLTGHRTGCLTLPVLSFIAVIVVLVSLRAMLLMT